MLTTFKKIAFALSVPAVLAASGWAQWTTLMANDATVAASAPDASRADVPRERPETSIADPRIKPIAVVDRTAGSGAQSTDPVVKAGTDPAKAKIVTYRIKPAPIPDRTGGDSAQRHVTATPADTEVAQADVVTYPRIKPVQSPDRTAGDGAQRPVPAAKADTALAQADAITDLRTKPAPSSDRLAGDSAAEPAQAAVPAAKANTEVPQANASLDPRRIPPASGTDRKVGKATTGQAEPPASAPVASVGSVPANVNVPAAPIEPEHTAVRKELSGETTKAALAEPQTPKSLVKEPATKEASTKAARERQVSLTRETKEDRPPRERARESRRIQSDATDARRSIVARYSHAEPARQQWFSGVRTVSERDRTTCW